MFFSQPTVESWSLEWVLFQSLSRLKAQGVTNCIWYLSLTFLHCVFSTVESWSQEPLLVDCSTATYCIWYHCFLLFSSVCLFTFLQCVFSTFLQCVCFFYFSPVYVFVFWMLFHTLSRLKALGATYFRPEWRRCLLMERICGSQHGEKT